MAIEKDKLKKGLESLGYTEEEYNSWEKSMQKAFQKIINNAKQVESLSNKTKSAWDDLTVSIAGVRFDDFISKIEIAQEDIAQMTSDMLKLNDVIKDSASSLNEEWIKSLNKGENIILNLIDNTADLSVEMSTALKKAVSSGNIGDFLETQGDIGMKALKELATSSGFKSLDKFVNKDSVRSFMDMNKEIKRMQDTLALSGKEVFDLGRGLDKIVKNLTSGFRMEQIKGTFFDFDKIIHETQKNTGVMLADTKANERQFTQLTTKAAQFGLSIQQSADLMGKLSAGLRTTNLDVLHDAAMDLAAMSSATGLSIDEVAELSSQMMWFGKTAKQVSKYSEDTMKSAYKYGISGKKIMQDINKSLPKTRELGWMGGADALKAMAFQAERLGQNIDELIDSSKKLRTLEGALESSADLALMGLNIDPLQMLGAARRGGKEYSDMIAQLGKGIGSFNKITGEMDFNPLDYDILKGRAEAVGMSVESLQKQLTKTAQDNQKIKLIPPSVFGGLRPEEQAFLLSSMKMEDGKLVNFNVNGVTDIAKLTKDNVRIQAEKTATDKQTLEKQAQQNMHFRESVEALKGSIMTMFTYLQPLIDKATTIVQGISQWFGNLPTHFKIAFAGLLAGVAAIYGAGKQIMAGYFFGLGFNRAATGGGFLGALKNIFRNPFRGATPGTVPGAGGSISTNIPPAAATGVSRLSEALRAMPSPAQLLALSVALVGFGLAIVGIGYGIKIASEGLSTLVTAFDGISNAGFAMGAVIAVMGGMIGIIWALVPAVEALSVVGYAGSLGLLALGAAFVGIGYGINLASTGFSTLVESFGKLHGSIIGIIAAFASISVVTDGFGLIAEAITPIIESLTEAGWEGALGLAALGVAFVGIGYGINLASKGLSELVKSFDKLENSTAALGAVIAVMGGVVGIMWLLPPVITAIGASLATLAGLGTAAIPIILAIGGGMTLAGLGIKFAGDGIAKIVKSFADLFAVILSGSNTSKDLLTIAVGLSAMVPALLGVGIAGLIGLPGLIAASLGFTTLGAALKIVGPGLESLSKIQLQNLSSIGTSLLNLVPGFAAFAGVSILSPLLLAGAMALKVLAPIMNSVAVGFASIGKIDWNSLSLISNTLLSLIPGLAAFSTLGILSPLIGVAAVTIGFLGSNLSKIKNIDLNLLSGIGDSLGNSVIGLLKFSTLGLISPLFALAGMALNPIITSTSKLKDLDTTKLEQLSQGLSASVGGFFKFSTLALVSPLLQTAGKSLTQIGLNANQISGVKTSTIETFSSSLANSVGGFIKFSAVGLFAPLLLLTGIAIGKLATGLMSIQGMDGSNIVNLGNTLGQSVGGFIKFSAVGLFAPLLLLAGMTIGKLATGLMSIQKIDGGNIVNLGNTIGQSVGGFIKFSAVGLFAPLLLLAGMTIGKLAKGLMSIQEVNGGNIVNLGNTIGQSVGGFIKFSAVGLFAPLLLLAGMTIGKLATGLMSIQEIDSNNIVNLGNTIAQSVGGFIKFSAVGLFAPLLLLAGMTIGKLATGLMSIQEIDGGNIINLGNTIGQSVGGFIKFSAVGLFAPLLLLAGMTIGKLAKGLISIQEIDGGNIVNLGNTIGQSVGGFIKFSAIGLFSPLLLLTGMTIGKLATGLMSIQEIDGGNIVNLGNTIGQSVGGFIKFSVVGLFSPLLLLAGMTISKLATGLMSIQEINGGNIVKLGNTIGQSVGGFIKFSVVGLFAPLLLLAGMTIGKLATGLMSTQEINGDNIVKLGNTIGQSVGGFIKFSTVGLFSPLLLLAGITIGKLAKGLMLIQEIDGSNIVNLGNTIGQSVGGFIKFSAVGLFAPLLLLAGITIGKLATGLMSIQEIDGGNIVNLGNTIGQSVGGFIKFSAVGLFAPLLLLAGMTIGKLATGLMSIQGIDGGNIVNLGNTIAQSVGGFIKFSAIGLFSPLLLLAGKTMSILASSLSMLKGIDITFFANIGQALTNISKTLGDSVSGFLKFSTLGIVSPLFALAALSFTALSVGLSKIKDLNIDSISSLGNALGSSVSGLLKFSIVGLTSPLLILAGLAVGKIATGLSQIKNVDFSSITTFGKSLELSVGGFVKFALLGLFAPLLSVAGNALTKLISTSAQLKGVDISEIILLSNSLADSVGGFIKFSYLGAFLPLITLAGLAISTLSKTLVGLSNINFSLLNNINFSLLENLSNALGNSVTGLVKFSAIGIIAPLLYVAGKAVNIVAGGLTSLKSLDLSTITGLGEALGNNVTGLFKFSSVGLIAPLLALATGSLMIISSGLSSLTAVNITALSGLGDALSSSVAGLFKFSSLGLVAPLLALSAMAMGLVTSGLSKLQTVDTDKIAQLGQALNSSVEGFMKFAAVGLVAPMLSKAGSSVGNLINGTSNLKSTNVASLGLFSSSLGDSVGGITKFSSVGLLSPLLSLAGAALSKLTGSISSLEGSDSGSFVQFSNSLGESVGGIFKFSSIGIISPLLNVATQAIVKLVNGFANIQTIDASLITSLGQALGLSSPGFLKFSTIGIAAPLLALAAGAIDLLSFGLAKLSNFDASIIGNMSVALGSSVGNFLKFSSLGLVSPLLILASSSLGMIGLALNVFKGVSTDALLGLSEILPTLTSALYKFSAISIISPLLLGASIGITTLGLSLALISPAFKSLASVNWDILSSVGEGLRNMTPGLLLFAGIGFLSIPILAGALALLSAGKMLTAAAVGFDAFNNINLEGIKKLGKETVPILSSLVSLSIIGYLAIPIAAGAVLLAIAGKMFSASAIGFNSFSKIDWDAINKSKNTLIGLSDVLFEFASFSITAGVILTGATLLAAAGGLFKVASYGFNAMAEVNWTSLKQMSSSLINLIPGLLGFAAIGVLAIPISLGAVAIGLAGSMLYVAAKGFDAMAKVNWTGMKSMNKSVNEILPALLKLVVLPALTTPILAGATMLGLAGTMFSLASIGFNSLSKINWSSLKSVGTHLLEMTPGLFAFSTLGIVSPLIMTAGLALSAIGLGLKMFQNIDGGTLKNIGGALTSMIPSLLQFSAVGLLSAPIALAGGALLILGTALAAVSNGINKVAGINWTGFAGAGEGLKASIPTFLDFAMLGVASAPLILGATALAIIGKSMSAAAAGFTSMSGIDWSRINAMGSSLMNLIPSLTSFGIGGILAVPGMLAMNMVLSTLASTITELGPALDVASKSMAEMSNSLIAFKSAIRGVDTTAFNNMAEMSDKIISAQVRTSTSEGSSDKIGTSVPTKVTINPITINMKLNGKDIHQEIVQALAHVS